MSTLLEMLTAQLNSVRAKVVVQPRHTDDQGINKPTHHPRNPAVDSAIHIGPKGGRYRITSKGRKVYL